MSSGKAYKQVKRGAPRYRVGREDTKIIRFVSTKGRRISTSQIYDISETGISFTSTHKLVPEIGEVIKMDFIPLGTMQMACMGRVIRIEEPKKGATWATFPDTVKVGVEYYQLPKPYRKVISNALTVAFERRVVRLQAQEREERWRNTWLYENWQSVLSTLIFLTAIAFGTYFLLEKMSTRQQERSPWAEGFFNKMIK